jgi:hypothetical protein
MSKKYLRVLLLEKKHYTFQLKSVVVNSEPRKLKCTWTPELAQDVHSYYSVDSEKELEKLSYKSNNVYKRFLLIETYKPKTFSAEEELTKLLSEQIAKEIDREIISLLNFNLSSDNSISLDKIKKQKINHIANKKSKYKRNLLYEKKYQNPYGAVRFPIVNRRFS